jgi:hypothetical protein
VRIITKRGYDFGEVSSAMQKAIRRADTRLAGYWALELWHSGYGNYVWKRLLTVSAEDVWGLITGEIKALHDSYALVNKGVPARKARGPHLHLESRDPALRRAKEPRRRSLAKLRI